MWWLAPALAQDAVTLVAVGDVLHHREVKATAAAHGWDAVFGPVAPYLREADVAFANLEAPIAPDAHKGVHGEVFNAPASLAPALAAAGFDVVSMANNHAWDQGADGLVETWRRVREAGVVPVGAGPTCADATAPRVIEVNGLKLAFVALTDLSNLPGSEGACLFVSGPVCEGDCGPDRDAIHYTLDEARILGAVRAADAVGDVVIVSFHWGIEYTTDPLPEYPRLAGRLVDAGADVVLGHHAHVLQPVERRGDALVAYGLGNFVSGMAAKYDPAASPASKGRMRDGAIVRIELAADGVTGFEVIPVWTDRVETGIAVRPLWATDVASIRRPDVEAALRVPVVWD